MGGSLSWAFLGFCGSTVMLDQGACEEACFSGPDEKWGLRQGWNAVISMVSQKHADGGKNKWK